VYATDISTQQIAQAPVLGNVHYSIERAEKTWFPDNYFDLITVAQAIHWFDIPKFYEEVRRVGRHHGVLAVLGYGLMQISDKIDPLIHRFYTDVVGPYWDPERVYIEERYETIDFAFPPIEFSETFQITQRMGITDLLGYLNSWSAVQKYFKKNGGDPVSGLANELKAHWPAADNKRVTFPIFIKAGRIVK
jgi:SAM-dependent methyltransferase